MPDYAPLREFQALGKEVELQSRELGSLGKRLDALERWRDDARTHLNQIFKEAKGVDDAIEKQVTRLERALEKRMDQHAADYNKALQHERSVTDQLDAKIQSLRTSLLGDVSKLYLSVSKLQTDVSKRG